ncbi:1129_t:CDS:1, partial [Scutellospora calospora]
MSQRQGQQQRRKRSTYVTMACTNCRQKHAKCSGKVTCRRCSQRNLECTFIDSGKRRGPRAVGRLVEQNYVNNGPELNFNGTYMLSSVIPNITQ